MLLQAKGNYFPLPRRFPHGSAPAFSRSIPLERFYGANTSTFTLTRLMS